MKVRVNDTLCQGHTLCAMAAPELFKLRDDDGHSYVEDENVPPGLQAKARAAEATCPERAIVIEDDG